MRSHRASGNPLHPLQIFSSINIPITHHFQKLHFVHQTPIFSNQIGFYFANSSDFSYIHEIQRPPLVPPIKGGIVSSPLVGEVRGGGFFKKLSQRPFYHF